MQELQRYFVETRAATCYKLLALTRPIYSNVAPVALLVKCLKEKKGCPEFQLFLHSWRRCANGSQNLASLDRPRMQVFAWLYAISAPPVAFLLKAPTIESKYRCYEETVAFDVQVFICLSLVRAATFQRWCAYKYI